jgi:hypothetical protein
MPLVIGEMARADPQVAANHFQQLPEDLRTAAASQIAALWAPRDAAAAERWALSLPSGPLQDTALGGILGNAELDPYSAVQTINLIREPQARALAAFAQVRRMLEQGNRDGAEMLLQRAALESPEWRAELRRVIDTWPTNGR